MEAERAEVIWSILSSIQKQALADAVTIRMGRLDVPWGRLTNAEKDSLLRLDWEVMLGRKFPKLNSK